MKIGYCTLFDRHYLARGLVMVRSLRRHAGPAASPVVALWLDEASFGFLRESPEPGVVPMPLAELEAADNGLAAAKADRSRLEYYFTLSPCLPRHLLACGGLDAVVSLDADLWFLRDLSELVRALEERPIFITAHGFSRTVARSGAGTGRFNVSFQGFRDDRDGRACLDRWRSQCLAWCRDEIDKRNGRYADQRYLDDWPERHPHRVTVFDPPIAGLAPWNIARFPVASEGNAVTTPFGSPVLYHFHGVRFLRRTIVADRLWKYRVVLRRTAIEALYGPYLEELARTQDEVSTILGDDRPLSGQGRETPLALALWRARTFFHLSHRGVTHHDLGLLHPIDSARRIGRTMLDCLTPGSEPSCSRAIPPRRAPLSATRG